jgi:hypothetical protein
MSGKTAAARDGAANHSRRPLSMAGSGRTLCNSSRVRERKNSGGERAGNTETVVVPVGGCVPVAVRRAEPVRIVVPGTAAKNAGRGSLTGMRLNTRKAHVHKQAEDI